MEEGDMENPRKLVLLLAALTLSFMAVAGSGADQGVDRAAVEKAARAIDQQLAAYHAVIGRAQPDGSVGPDPRAWAAVNQARDFTIVATHNVLDRLLGGDFERPWEVCKDCDDPKLPGRVRGFRDADAARLARELIDAARADVPRAIRSGRWQASASRLGAFFKRHPDYRPARGGRCFKGKKEGFPYGSSAECVSESLRELAGWVRGEAQDKNAGTSKVIGPRPRALCECEWSSDCPPQSLCLDGCEPQGRYDGKCHKSSNPPPV